MAYTPLQLAEAFIQTGELQDALDALNQHLEAQPADDAARRLRAQVLTRLRGETHLRAALTDWEQIVTPTADDRFRQGITLEQLGDREAAVQVWRELLAQSPGDERAAERLFTGLMALRRFDEARSLLDAMPRTSGWLTKAGDLATEDGHHDQAPGYYSEALDQLAAEFDLDSDAFARPIHANLLVARAQAYANLRRFQDADADYAAAQAIMTDDPLIPFWHSFVLMELGQVDQAVEKCRAALATPNPTLKAHIVANLKTCSENPTFAPLAALIPSTS